MPEHSGPIYEVRLFVDRDIANDCDQWLEEHVRDSLRVANVADCNVFSVSTDDPDRPCNNASPHGEAGSWGI